MTTDTERSEAAAPEHAFTRDHHGDPLATAGFTSSQASSSTITGNPPVWAGRSSTAPTMPVASHQEVSPAFGPED